MKKIILVLFFVFFMTGCTDKVDSKKLELAFLDYRILEENKEEMTIEYFDVSKEKRKIVISKKENIDEQIINESVKILENKHEIYLNGYFESDTMTLDLELYKIDKYDMKDFIPTKTSFFVFNTNAIYIQTIQFKNDISEEQMNEYFKNVYELTGMKINAIVNNELYYINGEKVLVNNKTDFYSKLNEEVI